MEKWTALLVAILMALGCITAGAEGGAPESEERVLAFEGKWSCSDDYAMDCYWDVEEFEDGERYSGYKIDLEKAEGEGLTYWRFSCAYDPETGRLENLFGDRTTQAKEGDPILETEEYGPGAAVFTYTEAGSIVWQLFRDGEKELEVEFEREIGFLGMWTPMEENYSLLCALDVAETGAGGTRTGYRITIEKLEGESVTTWDYPCIYNPEDNTLICTLSGTKIVQEKEGDPSVPVYDNGSATFSIDEEGCILWDDETEENAGEGLHFMTSNG